MQKKAINNEKIEIVYSHNVIRAEGDDKLLKQIVIQSSKTQNETTLECNGLFYGIGHTPNTSIFKEYIHCDSNGYIMTKPDSTETNIEGIFACGDVQDSKWRQTITAAGTGCISALEVEKYLEA